jgi:hypothetical protein
MREAASAMRKTSLIIASALPLLAAVWAAPAAAAGSLQPQGGFTGPSGSLYGYSVAIDGDTAVVGAINDNGGNGAAYVLVRSGTNWAQLQPPLTAPMGRRATSSGTRSH